MVVLQSLKFYIYLSSQIDFMNHSSWKFGYVNYTYFAIQSHSYITICSNIIISIFSQVVLCCFLKCLVWYVTEIKWLIYSNKRASYCIKTASNYIVSCQLIKPGYATANQRHATQLVVYKSNHLHTLTII